ncbi:hypothetical protein OHS33_38700 (plasmid) [Streptomyces sp. NBC_00536]|uniref:hypothetical protein n=1 Tax=Streptomyces sp. NBC_00536 TaxID=2975769 RepID=UPI002E812833|nr:hypothetical protein [Streptomyces sp. NBC_00536]WUC84433.1 hypothetical protein OHS33_38700 [Streptomyces sp. NBC_00536]
MSDAYAIADADPVAVVLAWLAEHPKVTEVLGGPGRVSGAREAPWPHLRVALGPGGNLRDLTWLTEPEVSLELYGDPGGWPGPAALHRILKVCAVAASELATTAPIAGRPVVSSVRPSGVLLESPLETGQPRWVMGLLVTLHPNPETS